MSAYNFDSLTARIDDSWKPVLTPFSELIDDICQQLEDVRLQGRKIAPIPSEILRVLEMPLSAVRVLIVGQDPYPIEGDAVGRAFAVSNDTKLLPQSLKNIFSELQADCHCITPPTPDLEHWVEQGVFLLNRCLSVEIGRSASHRNWGWQTVTDAVAIALAARDEPLVAILWGNDAQQLAPILTSVPTISSVHPSPLSAYRGFFGSRPFSRANSLLIEQGSAPISWC